MLYEAPQFFTTNGLSVGDLMIDESYIIPAGESFIPIVERPDLNYVSDTSRGEITDLNTDLANAEYRFWGNPSGFPYGTFAIVPVETQYDGERNVTIRQPAPYFHEAVLVLATNRPAPSREELVKAQQTHERIETVQFNNLHGAKEVFVAHLLGSFAAAVDTANADPYGIKPVGIIHHTPVTGELDGTAYPRSAGDLHATVGIVRRSNVIPGIRKTPELDAELKVMTPEVLFDLRRQMEGNLTDQGFGSDLISVKPRRNPSGIGIRLIGMDPSYLTTREGIEHTTAVFDAVSQVYPQVHQDIFRHAGSPTDAHRQVIHMSRGNLMYSLAPIPFGNPHGGGEASGYWPNRSTEYRYTPSEQLAVDIFHRKEAQFITASVRNLRRGR